MLFGLNPEISLVPFHPRAAGLGHPTLANEIPGRQKCLNPLPSNGIKGGGVYLCVSVCVRETWGG